MTTLANPQAFFDRVRPLFGGKLSQKQVDVLNAAIAASGADKPNSPIPAEARGLGIEGMIEATIGKEGGYRSEEHTSELQSLMRISYAVFCLNKKTKQR